jgi:hypothetical protein
MKRRNFLYLSVGTLIGAIAIRYSVSSDRAAIAKIIKKRLPYLKIDEEGLQHFATDAVAQKLAKSLRVRSIDAAGSLYFHVTLPPENFIGDKIRHTEDRVVTQFLMSSDFFLNHADKTRVVKYLGYYDPMLACNNPFARPVIV